MSDQLPDRSGQAPESAPTAAGGADTPLTDVDPTWAPPTSAPPTDIDPGSATSVEPLARPAQPRRRWLLSAGLALGLALVVVLVWGLGGFERRTDLLTPRPAGTLIVTGPYELTFTHVAAQRRKDFSDEVYWQLTAVGTGRTTGDLSIAPKSGQTGTFVSKNVRSNEVQVPSGVRYGEGQSFTDGARFTPGLPPVPILVDFRYSAAYEPDETLLFGVFQLKYADTSLIGGQDKVWTSTNHAFTLLLPVKVLPDATR